MTAEHVPPVFPGLLERLQADLGLATRFYTAGLRKPNDLGRLGTELMLRRLSIFLEDISVAPPLSLRRLTVALENVSRGHRQPFLTPVLAHRPRDTRRTTMMKAWAAAAMETLMEGGAKKLNAAEKVARVLVQAGYRLPGKKLPRAKTVAAWRDKLVGHSGGSEGTRYFKEMLTHASREDADLAERVKGILGAVALVAKSA